MGKWDSKYRRVPFGATSDGLRREDVLQRCEGRYLSKRSPMFENESNIRGSDRRGLQERRWSDMMDVFFE